MSTLFRLDASIRAVGSVTRAVADTLETTIARESGDLSVIRRDVGRHPVPSDVWPVSALAGYVPAADRTPEQVAALDAAARLGDELGEADVLLFSVPLYNFGVAQGFKTWFDVTATDPRFAPGRTPLAGRPAFLVTARGGGYGPGTPREGWDHSTGWLRRVLGDVWQLDLRVIEAELTLAEVTPQMASLRDAAKQQVVDAHAAAAAGARSVARQLAAAA